MTRARAEFGRRGRPVKTALPEGLPDAAPAKAGRKRSVAVALLTAGALSAAAVHFLERSAPAATCEPVAPQKPGSPAVAPAPVADGPAGGFGGETPCPPGTRRTVHTTSRRVGWFSGWHWSSSASRGVASLFSRSGSSGTSSAGSTSHASSSIQRGGFGSIGSFHFSGGS